MSVLVSFIIGIIASYVGTSKLLKKYSSWSTLIKVFVGAIVGFILFLLAMQTAFFLITIVLVFFDIQ